ncbi:MAG: glyoxalase [Saprospiraceae bacterium]|nr:glyoxalase [Saprospiraceae bacterium]
MDREQILTDIRPDIVSATFDEVTSEQEKLQNQVLRPIIKFQHEFLLVYFSQYLIKHKRDIKATDMATRIQIVEKLLQSDIPLRNVLIGSIIGFMTQQEVIKYYKYESELRNRIVHMIAGRLAEAI